MVPGMNDEGVDRRKDARLIGMLLCELALIFLESRLQAYFLSFSFSSQIKK
jgi:hypothetical protein